MKYSLQWQYQTYARDEIQITLIVDKCPDEIRILLHNFKEIHLEVCTLYKANYLFNLHENIGPCYRFNAAMHPVINSFMNILFFNLIITVRYAKLFIELSENILKHQLVF